MPRNFAIRLSCPHGDSDSWVTLSNREESLEQILQQTWEFKCREHGPQQGVPEEAMEVAPLDDPQPSPKTPVSFAVPFPATPAKKTPRSSERVPMRVPVVIYGFAGKGGAFHEDAETILVNFSGALVTLKAKLALGDTVFLVHKSPTPLAQSALPRRLDRPDRLHRIQPGRRRPAIRKKYLARRTPQTRRQGSANSQAPGKIISPPSPRFSPLHSACPTCPDNRDATCSRVFSPVLLWRLSPLPRGLRDLPQSNAKEISASPFPAGVIRKFLSTNFAPTPLRSV